MSPHVARMKTELEELDERLEKLHVFIEDSVVFVDLNKIEQRDLIDQRCAMTFYRDILRRRFERAVKGLVN